MGSVTRAIRPPPGRQQVERAVQPRDALGDREAESRPTGAAARRIAARERPFQALDPICGIPARSLGPRGLTDEPSRRSASLIGDAPSRSAPSTRFKLGVTQAVTGSAREAGSPGEKRNASPAARIARTTAATVVEILPFRHFCVRSLAREVEN
jgi:hypothetical protein